MSDDIQGPLTDEYLGEIDALTNLVESGQRMVDEGSSIDLSNLESAVGELCKRMAQTPPENPNAVMAAIEALVTRLSALGKALEAQSLKH